MGYSCYKYKCKDISVIILEVVVFIFTVISMIILILIFNGINDDSQYKIDNKFKIIKPIVEE